MLYNQKDIIKRIDTIGMLPFFRGKVEGISIEENIAPELWFDDEEGGYGVWDWKNDIIVDGDCAYGKLCEGKACFVSMQWFPHLAAWRRSHYKPTADEQLILDTVREHGSLLTREIKKLCGYTAPPRRRTSNPVERMAAADEPRPRAERRGFDSAMTRLQMGGMLINAAFEYSYTRTGQRYGWSVARCCTPEEYFGAERMLTGCSPEQSRDLLLEHLAACMPQATPRQLERMVG